MTVKIDGVERAIEFIEDVTEQVIGETIIVLEGRLKEETPIDTGFARNSWISTLSKNDEGTPGDNADATAQGFPERYSLGQVAYINNGADYIGVLEDGRSDQTPNGMVSVVLPEVPSIVDRLLQRKV